MKTKEEIMINHCAQNELIPIQFGKKILSAMDEYANIIAIEFEQWCTDNAWEYNYQEEITHTNEQHFTKFMEERESK